MLECASECLQSYFRLSLDPHYKTAVSCLRRRRWHGRACRRFAAAGAEPSAHRAPGLFPAPLAGRLNGFTIALLSDFHYDPYFSVHPLLAAIPLVNSLRPDLIVLTGDFVSVPVFGNEKKAALAAEPCARLLRQMTAPLGLWAVLGNHDDDTDPEHITRALQAENIQVLANQSEAIERDGARFWLAGVNDVISGTADLPQTLRSVPATKPSFCWRTNPISPMKPHDFPSTCSSPGTPTEARSDFRCCLRSTCRRLAKKYVLGTYQVGPLPLYTNAGLGTVGVPVRLNCPPEITLLTLQSSSSRLDDNCRDFSEPIGMNVQSSSLLQHSVRR